MSEGEFEFAVFQAGDYVAGGAGSDLSAIAREAHHYGAVYGQDGPVEVTVYRVTRTPVSNADILAAMKPQGA